MFFYYFQDPFREAKILAASAVKYALDAIDYSFDPPLTVPDKYKATVWFALPIDIASMLLKQKQNQDMNCDVNSIPFISDDAKVKFVIRSKKD